MMMMVMMIVMMMMVMMVCGEGLSEPVRVSNTMVMSHDDDGDANDNYALHICGSCGCFLSQKGRRTERGDLIKLKTEIAFAVSSYVHTFLCPEHCVNK